MVYFKSLLVGFAALVLAVPLLTITLSIAFVLFQRVPPPSHDGVISWDARSMFANPHFLWTFAIAAVLAFVAGFYWEFRRASH
jgi:hypothetical protein